MLTSYLLHLFHQLPPRHEYILNGTLDKEFPTTAFHQLATLPRVYAPWYLGGVRELIGRLHHTCLASSIFNSLFNLLLSSNVEFVFVLSICCLICIRTCTCSCLLASLTEGRSARNLTQAAWRQKMDYIPLGTRWTTRSSSSFTSTLG